MKALFTYDYGKEKMQAVRDLGYEVILQDEKGITYEEWMEDVEVLVCYNPFYTLDIGKMKSLKWIQLSSIGVDQVPKEIVQQSNILVTNNKGGYSIPMGEWVVLKMLEIYKKSVQLYRQQQEKQWKMNTEVLELYRKKVAFIGTGSIAIESAKRLQGFETHVIGVNTKGKEVPYFDKCYGIHQLDEVLKISDVVVITIPYTRETHHLINKGRLEKMKKNAVLINVARGSVIKEQDLIDHLKAGKLLGVALDVFEEEPLSKESPLWEMEKVIITPHNAWISEQRNERRFRIIFDNMKRYMEREPLVNLVDLEKGY